MRDQKIESVIATVSSIDLKQIVLGPLLARFVLHRAWVFVFEIKYFKFLSVHG